MFLRRGWHIDHLLFQYMTLCRINCTQRPHYTNNKRVKGNKIICDTVSVRDVIEQNEPNFVEI